MNTIERQARLLTLLADASHPGGSLRELARQLELAPSTVHRLLKSLSDVGMATQDPETKNYRLGGAVLRLAGAYLEGLAFTDLVAPHLERLSAATGLVAFSAVREGETILCTSVRAPRQTGNFYVRVGKLLPVHASAAAKALVYHLPWESLEPVLAASLGQRFTESTLHSLDAVLDDLEKGKRRGYWECNEELEPEVYAVAAPILDSRGEPIVSLTVVGRLAYDRDGLSRASGAVMQAAATATRELGPHLYAGQLVGAR